MNTIKLYQEFEKEVDPNRNLADGSDPLIIQYGFPGSGSTFVWQVMNSVFSNVKKTHNCPEYSENYKVVATVRDFRDVLCTYFKRVSLPVNKPSIDFLVTQHASWATAFMDLYKVSDIWGDKDNILWLKYENFFNNFEYLFSQIERFFQVKLNDEQREYAYQNYSLDANRQRVKQADSLCKQKGAQGWLDKTWVPYTVDGINGLHITADGSVGKWQHIIPETLHSHVNKVLEEPLKKYGYL